MEIIVNDTNIFIDMHSIGLLGEMCELPYIISTVDFVEAELTDISQRGAFDELVKAEKIVVYSFSADEVMEIVEEHSAVSGNLSIPDCSVCYYARKRGVPMLTGDRRLRRYAESQSIDVHGVLFLFDELVANGIVLPATAADRLEFLLKLNSRLPHSAVKSRIENGEESEVRAFRHGISGVGNSWKWSLIFCIFSAGDIADVGKVG